MGTGPICLLSKIVAFMVRNIAMYADRFAEAVVLQEFDEVCRDVVRRSIALTADIFPLPFRETGKSVGVMTRNRQGRLCADHIFEMPVATIVVGTTVVRATLHRIRAIKWAVTTKRTRSPGCYFAVLVAAPLVLWTTVGGVIITRGAGFSTLR